jgi:dienelactone hydrolase
MLEGMDRYLDRATAASAASRKPDRELLRNILGVVDPRLPFDAPPAGRWPVFTGLDGEGLLFQPSVPVKARIVALPDADQAPEQVLYAQRLAASGYQVIVPALVDRGPTGIVNPLIPRPQSQPKREFLYRMAFEMGRHLIGFEIQKTLAAVDWFSKQKEKVPIYIAGYGEGGLVALYSAAVDERIDKVLVSGYFAPREQLWREPVYRNVWGLLKNFGDAEVAALIAPREVLIEPSRAPPALETPTPGAVRSEVERAKKLGANIRIVSDLSGRDDAMTASSLESLGVPLAPQPAMKLPSVERKTSNQLHDYIQNLVRTSERKRIQFQANRTPSEQRRHLWEEILGKLPPSAEPLLAQTRQIYDKPKFTGHEVVIPVHPDVFAYGILLVPKDLKAGERRPVVVAQHGRAGRPQELIEPSNARSESVYKHFAAQLAERGFVVYAPQNPYIFEEHYRTLQRKANPLKLSLFSFIAAQHERTLDWLASLPFIDPQRIGFYGLSYGGKTAVRIPPLLDRYALSVASGDFGEYIGKMASTERSDSFMFTIEHEMYEFNLGNTFNYSDMANLMAPRPFMVERGHNDGVGQDEWVDYEYARVRRFYVQSGLGGKTEIEFFNGVHEIRAEGTFRFLHKHLNWPEPTAAPQR